MLRANVNIQNLLISPFYTISSYSLVQIVVAGFNYITRPWNPSRKPRNRTDFRYRSATCHSNHTMSIVRERLVLLIPATVAETLLSGIGWPSETITADIRLLGTLHRSKSLHAPPPRPTHRGLATNYLKRWLDSLLRSTKLQFRDCYQSPRVDGCLAHKQLRLCQAARRARFPSSRSGIRAHFL